MNDSSLWRPVVFDPPPADLPALIQLAVADARSLDRDLYVPRFGFWHMGSVGNQKCKVCFAGAVMAVRLYANPEEPFYEPKDFSMKWMRALEALDHLRQCMIASDAADKLISEGWLTSAELSALDHSESFVFNDWPSFDRFLMWAEGVADTINAIRANSDQ